MSAERGYINKTFIIIITLPLISLNSSLTFLLFCLIVSAELLFMLSWNSFNSLIPEEALQIDLANRSQS